MNNKNPYSFITALSYFFIFLFKPNHFLIYTSTVMFRTYKMMMNDDKQIIYEHIHIITNWKINGKPNKRQAVQLFYFHSVQRKLRN